MRALLVGESWHQVIIHQKGIDQFHTSAYEEGAEDFERAVLAEGIDLDWMRAHDVPARFPFTEEELAGYDVVVISDIGANSFLLAPEVTAHSQSTPNRLQTLRAWTRGGGGLVMVGGYLSFAGIDGRARFGDSPLADVLPVEIGPHDDRVERPEGVVAEAVAAGHPILEGIDEPWPPVLGYNRLVAGAGAQTLAQFDHDPALVVGEAGNGRSVAFASDLAPHWAPPAFVGWSHYARLWSNLLRWAAHELE